MIRGGRDALLRAFADGLDGVRLAAGKPTYTRLERHDPRLRRATMSDALTGKTSPSLDFTLAFVRACRAIATAAGLPVDDPVFDRETWWRRWHELQVALRPHRRGRPAIRDHVVPDHTPRGHGVGDHVAWAHAARGHDPDGGHDGGGPGVGGPGVGGDGASGDVVSLSGAPRSWVRRHEAAHAQELVTALSDAYAVGLTTVWISGAGGAGKTALAVRWASAARELFTDDALFVGLRAHADDGPVPIEAALASLVERLGGGRRFDGPSCREFLTRVFRELTAERRLVVIADDAATGHEVERLTPAGPGSFLIVTSRHQPVGTDPDAIVLPIEKWAS